MKSMLRVWVGAAVVALHVSGTAGVTGTISTEVSPVLDPVNYNGVAAFDVTIENVGGNVANAVVFTGQATKGTFLPVEGADCQETATSVSCSLGQMRPGDIRSFTVLLSTPPTPQNPPSEPEVLAFTGLTYFSEGTGGPKSKPTNSTSSDTESVKLSVPTGTSVASVVPGNGAPFSLGTVKGDGFDTQVTVPPQASRTTAHIDEATFAASCSNFNACYTSTVTIPGTFTDEPYLSIVLHQDASNIKSGTQIGSVVIFYSPDGSSANEVPVGACPSETTPLFTGVPCIAKAVHYKNRSVEGWTRDLDGDMVWWLLNTLNGSYRLP